MSEDWAAVAADVSAAMSEVGFSATLTRPAPPPATPWATPSGSPQTFTITVIDGGIKTKYSRADDGALIPRTVRALTIAAGGEAPQMGDTITIGGVAHEATAVMPTSPGGEVVVWQVELAI